jgi:uncharacterized protein
MPVVDRHAPGAFCWAELHTTDQDAAKRFYTTLFEWGVKDIPMGPDGVYSMVTVGGHEVGGLCTLQPQERAHGVPPHWLPYFAVQSADEGAGKAGALGGQVLAGPFDVGASGRMAVVRDPAGAVFATWQAAGHIGIKVVNEPHAPTWPELATRDTAQAEAFYSGLFGWSTKKEPGAPLEYTEWKLGGESFGGMLKMDERWGGAPPHWLIYFLVKDCSATAEKARQLGGNIRVPPQDIPNVGRFAVLADAQGSAFQIIQLSHPM